MASLGRFGHLLTGKKGRRSMSVGKGRLQHCLKVGWLVGPGREGAPCPSRIMEN